MRVSGVVLPVFALPSDYGIGSLGKDAAEFIDFLAAANIRVWETMSVCHTDGSHSPFRALCARAGNPLLLDLAPFVENGVVTGRELSRMDWGRDRGRVNYSKVAAAKLAVLERVYTAADGGAGDPEFARFAAENRDWLEDYGLFAALCEENGGMDQWPESLTRRLRPAMDQARDRLGGRARFFQYVQYLFYGQWERLRRHAAERGVRLMGSIPYDLPESCCERWQDPAAGETGGDFLGWWRQRMAQAGGFYDFTKICRWVGSEELFAFYDAARPDWPQFGEKLTALRDAVPGALGRAGRDTRAFQRGFGSQAALRHRPHWYERDTVAYVGICTDEPVRGWLRTLDRQTAQDVNEYIGTALPRDQAWSVLRCLWMSPAAMVMAPVADFLEMGSAARLAGGDDPAQDWTWRLRRGALNNRLAQRIARMNRLFER